MVMVIRLNNSLKLSKVCAKNYVKNTTVRGVERPSLTCLLENKSLPVVRIQVSEACGMYCRLNVRFFFTLYTYVC